jgi:hypothetical protein
VVAIGRFTVTSGDFISSVLSANPDVVLTVPENVVFTEFPWPLAPRFRTRQELARAHAREAERARERESSASCFVLRGGARGLSRRA